MTSPNGLSKHPRSKVGAQTLMWFAGVAAVVAVALVFLPVPGRAHRLYEVTDTIRQDWVYLGEPGS